GEKVSALEVFHPDRLAKRLLDMGDVLSLVEKVQETVSAEELARDREKILKNDMSLDDFLKQMQQLKKLGGLQSLMGFLPGMGALKDKLAELPSPDVEMKRMEAILQSMTPQERKDPRVLNGSRRERIARGSGTRVQDVNKLLRQFEETKKMMGMFRRGGMSALGNHKNFQGVRRR
ncbi:MAG: signal recognition particle protein, partial [Bdellovibrio sp.]